MNKAWKFFWVELLLLPILSLTFLNSCEGGTSTNGDNPALTVHITGTDFGNAYQGYIEFYETASNPTFFTSPVDDGISDPAVSIGGIKNYFVPLQQNNYITISNSILRNYINQAPSQALYKGSATHCGIANSLQKIGSTNCAEIPIPKFNIIFLSGNKSALLSGIFQKFSEGKFFNGDSNSVDTLVANLKPSLEYAGAIDTSNLMSRALGIFVPGTPFYASVHGDSFHLANIPVGKMPLRLLTAKGIIYDMLDSLGAPLTHRLKPGAKQDSVALPKPNPILDEPTATPSGQWNFTDSVSITLTQDDFAIICYTLDGSTPTSASTKYTEPIKLRSSATLKAAAFKKGYTPSAVMVNNYVLVPAEPVFNPTERSFHDSLKIEITTTAQNVSIYYSLDGSVPGTQGPYGNKGIKYTGPLTLKNSTTVKAVTVSSGLGNSRTVTEKYTMVADSIPLP